LGLPGQSSHGAQSSALAKALSLGGLVPRGKVWWHLRWLRFLWTLRMHIRTLGAANVDKLFGV
jgi:hypothetical protein